MRRRRFPPADQLLMRAMAAAGGTPKTIAKALGRSSLVVRRWLNHHGVAFKRVRMPAKRRGAYVDNRAALAKNEPGIVGEPPLRDDLTRCEQKWAALFGAPITLAYTRRGRL